MDLFILCVLLYATVINVYKEFLCLIYGLLPRGIKVYGT